MLGRGTQDERTNLEDGHFPKPLGRGEVLVQVSFPAEKVLQVLSEAIIP